MIRASCHCGSVSLEVPSAPAEVTACNCSICRCYGVLWAYYQPKRVRVVVASGAGTDVYTWDDKSIEFYRCRICGCISHWAPFDPTRDRMGVNARLMEPDILARARVRHLDGAVTEQYLD